MTGPADEGQGEPMDEGRGDPMDEGQGDPMDEGRGEPIDGGESLEGRLGPQPEGEPDEDREELDPREREDIEADLADLAEMRSAFERQGVRGVVIACPDCGSNHYYAWDLLRENLEHMLDTGEPRMHEPAYEPREQDYVQWDYAKGYVDALADAGVDPDRKIDLKLCPWCDTRLEFDFQYCPHCGRLLAGARLFMELVEGGMDERDARAMLTRAGFEPF